MSNRPLVVTLLVNFGAARLIEQSLELLVLDDYNQHVVVWENGHERQLLGHSLGDRWEDDRKRTLTYIGGWGNQGYARGITLGYEAWRNSVAEPPLIVHCMNPDTRSSESTLPRLIDSIELGAADIAGPLTRFDNGSVRPSVYPKRFGWFAWVSFLDLALYRRFGPRPRPGGALQRVSVIDGAYVVTRGRLWEDLGGLDPGFLISGDDQDFCRRARDAGASIALVPGAEIVHVGGATRGSRRLISLLSEIHSTVRFAAKHRPHSDRGVRRSIAAVLRLRYRNPTGRALASWARHVPVSLAFEHDLETSIVKALTTLPQQARRDAKAVSQLLVAVTSEVGEPS